MNRYPAGLYRHYPRRCFLKETAICSNGNYLSIETNSQEQLFLKAARLYDCIHIEIKLDMVRFELNR